MTQACSTNLLMIITDVETTAACCSSDLRVLRCRIERVGYVNVGGVPAMLVLSRRKCALRHGGDGWYNRAAQRVCWVRWV